MRERGTEIRAALPGDVAGIASLVTALAQERGRESGGARSEQAILGCLAQPGHEILVAVDRNELIAYVAVHWVPFPLLGGREGYISDLVVRADWRGQGIGNRLLESVQERAEQLGCRRLMLHNRIEDESFRRGFYVKSGFQERTTYATFVKFLQAHEF